MQIFQLATITDSRIKKENIRELAQRLLGTDAHDATAEVRPSDALPQETDHTSKRGHLTFNDSLGYLQSHSH